MINKIKTILECVKYSSNKYQIWADKQTDEFIKHSSYRYGAVITVEGIRYSFNLFTNRIVYYVSNNGNGIGAEIKEDITQEEFYKLAVVFEDFYQACIKLSKKKLDGLYNSFEIDSTTCSEPA